MGVHIHLLKLSDEFRRHASPNDVNYDLLVDLTNELAEMASLFDHDAGFYDWRNYDVFEGMVSYLKDMIAVADDLGKKKICLPFTEDNKIAQQLQEEYMDPQGNMYEPELYGRFTFMKRPYKRDLSDLGAVDKRTRTVFDLSLRKHVDIGFDVG